MKGIPVYLEIKKKLLKEIEEKPVNTPICSERELSFMHKSSRMTVRRAIDELVDEGILYRDKNRGTFVADRKLNWKNTATEDLQNRETSDYRIIYYSVKDADRQIAPFLGIGTQDLMLRIVRVNEANGEPKSVEELYFNWHCFQNQEKTDLMNLLDMERYLQNGFINQKFIPMTVPVKYVNLLKVKTGVPIIMVESTIMSKEGEILVYIREYNHPEKIIEITS